MDYEIDSISTQFPQVSFSTGIENLELKIEIPPTGIGWILDALGSLSVY
jgi:hypothetical protein